MLKRTPVQYILLYVFWSHSALRVEVQRNSPSIGSSEERWGRSSGPGHVIRKIIGWQNYDFKWIVFPHSTKEEHCLLLSVKARKWALVPGLLWAGVLWVAERGFHRPFSKQYKSCARRGRVSAGLGSLGTCTWCWAQLASFDFGDTWDGRLLGNGGELGSLACCLSECH